MNLEIRPISYALGAEIGGIDFRKTIDDKTFSEIRAAFVKYSVLLFRGAALTREQHVAFSRKFGELESTHPAQRLSVPGHPELRLVITKRGSSETEPGAKRIDKNYEGELWHSDDSQTLAPAMASLLRAVEIPTVGGDTMFANMYLAYKTLSDGMKKLIEGLHCIYVGGGSRIDNSTPERLAETLRLNRIAHPLVKVHPETGRKSLFVEEKLEQFVGMTVDESKPLIQFLCKHATNPQFVYRHRWQKDDVVMWDNRCLLHKAVDDYDHNQTRHMERTTVNGAPSGYVVT